MTDTNVNDFMENLGGGVVKAKIAHLLSEAATGTIMHAKGKNTGEVTIKFSLKQINDNDQVMVTAKIIKSVPTSRGKQTMEDSTDTPMFVGKGGELTIDQPKEDFNGQFSLRAVEDGK